MVHTHAFDCDQSGALNHPVVQTGWFRHVELGILSFSKVYLFFAMLRGVDDWKHIWSTRQQRYCCYLRQIGCHTKAPKIAVCGQE